MASPTTASTSDAGSAKPLSFPRYLCSQIKTKPKPVTDVDLHGKTALVTGSNCGVGLETSRQLLDLGLSKLILAVRDEEKGRQAAADLSQGRKGFDPKTIEVWKLDQCEYGSVVAFADRAKRTLRRLDIAVLNVGIYPAKRRVNAETAHDEIIQTAAFTRFFPVGNPQQPIFPAMDALGKAARNTADRMFVSKLLGQFFLAKLASVVPPSVAVINAASPGSVHDSRFAREFEGSKAGAVTKICLRRFGNTAAVGARMMTDAAVRHGEETHGKFLSFQKVVRMAPIIYTKNGAMISQHLWRETMEELSFANVAQILEDVAN
ncbi:NAD(P)-binding protein [Apiospora hydei]|uniref:NAD(P)-binding protein n=1 Tax=Apiospora hydei TaxID=1337664 RepID=A0ABR1WX16_9PEZI